MKKFEIHEVLKNQQDYSTITTDKPKTKKQQLME